MVTLVGAGLRNAEIARKLFTTEGAVKKRIQSVFAKLCLPNRAAIAAWAVRSGLLDPLSITELS